MRPTPLLLAASLAANAALVALLVLRPHDSPAAAAAPVAAAAARPADPKSREAMTEALAKGDFAAMVAAGVPEDTARSIIVGRAFDRLFAHTREARSSLNEDARYWRRFREDFRTYLDMRQKTQAAQREFSNTIRQLYGADIDSLYTGRDSKYSYLSPAKREQLRRIEQDYEDMQMQLRADQNGIDLPADREKRRLLNKERERDFAAAMSPEDREQYELHESPAANYVQRVFGAALESEEDYRKIFALRKALTDQFPTDTEPRTPDERRLRREAEQDFFRQIDASLTDAQRTALQRANDPDLQALDSLSKRLNLPSSVTDVTLALRTTYATQSLAIANNSTLSEIDKRAQLRDLATRAQNDLRATLGGEAVEAYSQRSTWIGMLRSGSAFSTNLKDAPKDTTQYSAVYRVGGPPRSGNPPFDE